MTESGETKYVENFSEQDVKDATDYLRGLSKAEREQLYAEGFDLYGFSSDIRATAGFLVGSKHGPLSALIQGKKARVDRELWQRWDAEYDRWL